MRTLGFGFAEGSIDGQGRCGVAAGKTRPAATGVGVDHRHEVEPAFAEGLLRLLPGPQVDFEVDVEDPPQFDQQFDLENPVDDPWRPVDSKGAKWASPP
jgi:hypothetical protein